jgi:AraC-like DNA-binding protein
VTYCYKGVFPLVIDGSPVTLDSGDCVVMDRNVPHKVEATDPDTLAVNIVLSNRFFERRMMSDIARLHTRFATELATAGAPHRRFGIYRTHGDEFARDCVDRILCEHLDYTVGSADIIDDFVAALLTYLFRTFESDSEAFEQDERRSELVGVMREYIAQHYAEGSLKKMAQDLGYDSTYLSSLIRQGTGCSFKQLVNEERMQHATVLLQMTSMPANEVAGAVGISNLTQFYKRFREFAGCTPKEFREKASYGRA